MANSKKLPERITKPHFLPGFLKLHLSRAVALHKLALVS